MILLVNIVVGAGVGIRGEGAHDIVDHYCLTVITFKKSLKIPKG
jgi:hypothetical protein